MKELLCSSSNINWHYFYDLLFSKYSTEKKLMETRNEIQSVDATDFSSSDCFNSSENNYEFNYTNESVSNIPLTFSLLSSNSNGIDCTDARKIGVAVNNLNDLQPRSPFPWNGNLKLVHIACHIKLPHDIDCDPRYILCQQPVNQKKSSSKSPKVSKVTTKKRNITIESDGDETDCKVRRIEDTQLKSPIGT